MLNHVTKYAVVIVFSFLIACNQKKKDDKERNNKILKISRSTIGEQEYNRVYKQVSDSLNTWCLAKLPAYESVWYYTYRLDSVLCFNSEKDRMVTAILVQCDLSTCQMDNVHYFYGAKIKGQWYFFFGGGTMAIPRENYQSDIHIPLSFQKLHELAMNNMFRGYLKKNKDGVWQINEAFFTHHFEGVGWGDFNKQSHKDTAAYGRRFTNKKEYYESIYLRGLNDKWIKEEKKANKPQD
ncbi:MAG: hypothetical protein E6Q66_03230 [Pedobacter sp.]|nr:MAG: hypothetical protein E6Q66_03230 [Pedobacter sp.]